VHLHLDMVVQHVQIVGLGQNDHAGCRPTTTATG
jgi:hypothetical protein